MATTQKRVLLDRQQNLIFWVSTALKNRVSTLRLRIQRVSTLRLRIQLGSRSQQNSEQDSDFLPAGPLGLNDA